MGWLANLFGISEEELEKIRGTARAITTLRQDLGQLHSEVDRLKRATDQRLDELTAGSYGNVVREILDKLDRNQLVTQAREEAQRWIKEEVQRAVQETIRQGKIADTIWENLDEETLIQRVVETIAASDKLETWLKETSKDVASAIADSILENENLDMEELANLVAERIVNRLQWTKPE